jgi:uncharacterized protein
LHDNDLQQARDLHLSVPCSSTAVRKEINMTMQDLERSEGPTSVSMATASTPRRSLRGFAAMDPQRQREIASLGGRAAHQSGHAHEFTSDEARAAGRKRHAKGDGHAG